MVRVCDVKVVMGRIRHHVGGDGGEAARGVRRRKGAVAYCDGGDAREEGKQESVGGEDAGVGDGNIEAAPGLSHPFWFQAWGIYRMDLKGGRRVDEGVGQKTEEGEWGEDGDGAFGGSIPLQTLHEHHSGNIKCTGSNLYVHVHVQTHSLTAHRAERERERERESRRERVRESTEYTHRWG